MLCNASAPPPQEILCKRAVGRDVKFFEPGTKTWVGCENDLGKKRGKQIRIDPKKFGNRGNHFLPVGRPHEWKLSGGWDRKFAAD